MTNNIDLIKHEFYDEDKEVIRCRDCGRYLKDVFVSRNSKKEFCPLCNSENIETLETEILYDVVMRTMFITKHEIQEKAMEEYDLKDENDISYFDVIVENCEYMAEDSIFLTIDKEKAFAVLNALETNIMRHVESVTQEAHYSYVDYMLQRKLYTKKYGDSLDILDTEDWSKGYREAMDAIIENERNM